MNDPDNPEIGEPKFVTAGSTSKWRRSLPNHLPADSWVLTYGLSNGEQQVIITATNNSDGTHLAVLTVAASDDMAAGDWEWQAFVTKSSERYDVGRGQITVRPNLADDEGADARSNVKKTLDALEAMIVGKASVDQIAMSIRGRSLSRLSWAELLDARATFVNLYREETAADRRDRGLAGGDRITTRFPPR